MPDRKTQKLLEGLQSDLERELRGVFQSIYQSALLLGLDAVNVAPLLRAAAEKGWRRVAFVSDQIVNLGGTPKLTAPKFSETRDLKQMLENDLDAEREGVFEYRERVKQAEAAGEIGLRVRLEELIADKTDHIRMLERILRGAP